MDTFLDLQKIFYKENGKSISIRFKETWLKKINLYDYIMEKTQFLSENYGMRERVYAILNGITEAPFCENCGKETFFADESPPHFSKYCSNKCAAACRPIESYAKRDYKKANEKRSKTLLEKYGYEYNSQRPEVKEILSERMKEQLNSFAREKLYNKEWLIEQYVIKKRPSVDIAKELNCDYTTILSYCEKYGIEIRKYSNTSTEENELRRWLEQSTSLRIEQNDRKVIGKELDIWIPEKKIAIEYNGLLFHSEAVIGVLKQDDFNKLAHYNKYKNCLDKNIQLITIFTDEWMNRRKQVQNRILSVLGIYKEKIQGRDCTVREIENQTARDFINTNHLQKVIKIKKGFGLFHKNELVGVVCYSDHHRDNSKLILNRLAFKSGIQILGGSSKLIKNSINTFERNVITWSDNRWSTGKMYNHCGFQFDGDIGVDFSYTTRESDFTKRLSKQTLKEFEKQHTIDVTNNNWMMQNGYYRVYDCGKKRWIYHNEK